MNPATALEKALSDIRHTLFCGCKPTAGSSEVRWGLAPGCENGAGIEDGRNGMYRRLKEPECLGDLAGHTPLRLSFPSLILSFRDSFGSLGSSRVNSLLFSYPSLKPQSFFSFCKTGCLRLLVAKYGTTIDCA